MSALVFSSIRKTFGQTVALEGLDLAIQPGELISLLGPSGCGKTTALRIVAGFEKPDSGSVTVASNDVTNVPAHKRNMGMVFQSYSLFPNLTVEGNVEYGLRTRKLPKQERQQRVGEMLELVQLSSQAKKYPHQMSGGQQQRVALARALAIRPEVLLLDEPLSALDAKVRTTLRDEIRRIQTELGITTLFVTHDQEEALGISDRIGVMSNGRLEQLGAPRDVYRHPSSAFVARFVGSMNDLSAVALGPDAVRVGATVISTPAAAGLSAGQRVRLLVRPEDMALLAIDAGLPGTITNVHFQGASAVISVRLDSLDVLVAVHTAGTMLAGVVPGARVGVAVDGARAVIEITE